MAGFARGDYVRMTAPPNHPMKAMVTLASENGRSVMLMFEGAWFFPDGAATLGMLPVLLDDDGKTWRDIVQGNELTLEPWRRDD